MVPLISLRDAEEAIREAIEHGTPSQCKALLQALVAGIRVEGRDAIYPTLRRRDRFASSIRWWAGASITRTKRS